jgi:hypothetical protein
MKMIVFDQWDKLVARFRTIAIGAAAEKSQHALVRLEPKGGAVRLEDHAMNNLAISGGKTTVAMPDIVPGKARNLTLRVAATGENEIAFTGAEAFEGEADALLPPGDGETVVYFLSETAADVFLVARRKAERITIE